jgi:hypothetical protein
VRIAVVTSSPPKAEGGHMVIARELAQAIRESGDEAEIVITPDYGFGRQARAYWDTWRTDISHVQGRRVDRVISLAIRATRCAIRITCRGSITRCASTTTCGRAGGRS